MPESRSRLPTLENETMSVSIDYGFGARVTSLHDKRSRREWLIQGGQSRSTGEDAVYGADEAVGWDECFPTVSRCDASDTPWRRRLRDHGDLWGRPWEPDISDGAVTTSFADRNFSFSRRLSLSGDTLTADYSVTNKGSEALPYLWCQHCLLATGPGDSISLPGIDRVAAAYVTSIGAVHRIDSLAWPDHGLDLSVPRLDRVSGPEARFAGKFYAPVAGDFRALIGNADGRLEIGWAASELAHVGIWLDYGAWPGNGVFAHQIAIEPTTAAADHLAGAIAGGQAIELAPGECRQWRVTFRVTGS